MVLAPENKLVDELKDRIKNWKEVEEFRNAVKETVENHSSNITKSPNASKPKVKLGDLGLGQLDGLSKVDKDGIVETFYLIGVHNVRVKYDEFTREVVSLSVDGRITDIKDQESVKGAIDSINAILQMTGNHK